MDECDLDIKISAYEELEKDFNGNVMDLEEMASTLGEALVSKKALHIKNLSKAMCDLVKSLVHEIEDSREEMYKMIESLKSSMH